MEEHNTKFKMEKCQLLIPYDDFMKQTMQDGAEGEKHEVFSALMSSDEDYAWVTSGSRLYVVNSKSGSHLSYHNFNDAEELPGQTQYITFVEQFFVKGYSLPFLIVSTNNSKEGFISIFNPLSWMIKRRVNIGRQISCLAVVDNQNDSRQGFLSNMMSGILAVGCTDGSLILMDMRSDVFLDTTNYPLSRDSEASNLKFVNFHDSPSYLQSQHSLCMETGDSLAYLMLKGKPGYHGISALYHSKESACLFVGFGRGSWEVWNILNFQLLYTMSAESDYPVYSFAQLEPCDDPKHVLYIWVSHQIINNNAVMSLHSFAFEKKEDTQFGRNYKNLKSCALVFEFFTDKLFLNAESGKLISCFSLPIKNSKGHSKLLLKDEPKALAFTGLSVDYKKFSRSYLVVFDLEQWYKSQMPSSTLSMTQYLDLVTVTEGAVEGIEVFRRSLKFDNKGTHEVYSYPQSLSYDILCSCDAQFIKVRKPSLQASWFQNVERLGSLSFFNSLTLCKEAIRAGIIPKFSDPMSLDLSAEKQTREFLLSIFLDYNLTSTINDAILGWCKATKSSEDGNQWNFVFDWMWDTVSKIWEKANSVCSKFFDGSGVKLEHINEDYVYYSEKTIDTLVHLLNNVSKNMERNILEEKVQQKLRSMQGMVLYLKFVHLFAKENLLPEKNCDGQPESSILYDFNLLLSKSETLRNDLKTKFFTKFNNCLLPKKSLYLFDHVVGDFGHEIYVQWEKEGGISMYPPSTIQSLLRICLLQIPENVILCVFHYFILDMIHLLPNEQYSSIKKLKKFEEMIFSKNEEYFLLKGIWMLDHLRFKEGLDCFFHPKSGASSLPPEIHKAILLNFIVHDEEKIAYKYLAANGYCFSDLDDLKLEFRVLISQGEPHEAYQFQRKQKKYKEELFNQLLEACLISPPLRDFIAKADLDPFERKLCEAFFNNNNSLSAKRFHTFYLIHNKRYLQANTIQKKIKSNSSSDCLLKNIVKGFYSTMSSYAKDKEECEQLEEAELAGHIVTKSAFPRPLSCFIKVGKDLSIRNVSSRKDLMVAVEASSWHLNKLRKQKSLGSSENTKDSDSVQPNEEVPEFEMIQPAEDFEGPVEMIPLCPESPMAVDTPVNTPKSSFKKRQGKRWIVPESKRRKVEMSTPSKWTSPPNFGGTPLVKKEAPIVLKERSLTHSILKSTPKKLDENSIDSVNLTPKKNIRFCVPENTSKSAKGNLHASLGVSFKIAEENSVQEAFSSANIQEVKDDVNTGLPFNSDLAVESDNLEEDFPGSNDTLPPCSFDEKEVKKSSVVIEEIDLVSSESGESNGYLEDMNNDDFYGSERGSGDENHIEHIQGYTTPSNFVPSAATDDDSSLEVVEIVRNVKAPPVQLAEVDYRRNEVSLTRKKVYESSSSQSSSIHYPSGIHGASRERANIYDTSSSQSSSQHFPPNPQGAINDMIMDMVDEENSSKYSESSEESSNRRSSPSSQSSADVLEVEGEVDDEEVDDEEVDDEEVDNDKVVSSTDSESKSPDGEQNLLFADFVATLDDNSNRTRSFSEFEAFLAKQNQFKPLGEEPAHDPLEVPLDNIEKPAEKNKEGEIYVELSAEEMEKTSVDREESIHPTFKDENSSENLKDLEDKNSVVTEDSDVDYLTLTIGEDGNFLEITSPREIEPVTTEEKDNSAPESEPLVVSEAAELENEESSPQKSSCTSKSVEEKEASAPQLERISQSDILEEENENSAPCLERISEPERVEKEAPQLEEIATESGIVEVEMEDISFVSNDPPHLERISEPEQTAEMEAPCKPIVELEQKVTESDPVEVEMKDASIHSQSDEIVNETPLEPENKDPRLDQAVDERDVEGENEDPAAESDVATPELPKKKKRKYTQPLTPGYALRRSNDRLNMAIIEPNSPKSRGRPRRSQRALSAEPRLESSPLQKTESLMVIEEESFGDLSLIASPNLSSRPKRKIKTPLKYLSFEDSPQLLDRGMLASDSSQLDLSPETSTSKKGSKKATPGVALKKSKAYKGTPGHALKKDSEPVEPTSTGKRRTSLRASSVDSEIFRKIDFTEDSEEETPKKKPVRSKKAASAAGDLETSSERLDDFEPEPKNAANKKASVTPRKRGRPKKTLASFLKPKDKAAKLEKINEEEVQTDELVKKKTAKNTKQITQTEKLSLLYDKQELVSMPGRVLRSGKSVSYSSSSTDKK